MEKGNAEYNGDEAAEVVRFASNVKRLFDAWFMDPHHRNIVEIGQGKFMHQFNFPPMPSYTDRLWNPERSAHESARGSFVPRPRDTARQILN